MSLAELRRHPVSGDWVVICPERNGLFPEDREDVCIQCPGHESRTGKEILRFDGGDNGWRLRVVAGLPPVFHVEGDFSKRAVGICDRMEAIGAHELVIETPHHDRQFEDLSHDEICTILTALKVRMLDLAGDTRLKQVVAFKARFFDQSARASHPCWHIISAPFVPALLKEELNGAREYFAYKERCVFCDYLVQEQRTKARLISADSNIAAVSPYAARLPFQVWLLPTRHSPDYAAISAAEIQSLAATLKRIAGATRKLPAASGYTATIHTAPFRRPKTDAWRTIDLDYHWHVEIDPVVSPHNGLRESGGFHLNTVPPEEAAAFFSAIR